jgi:hypothetical protein
VTRPSTERPDRQRAARAGVPAGRGHAPGRPQGNPHPSGTRTESAQQRGQVPQPRGSGTYGVAARGRGQAYRPAPARRTSRLSRFVETYGWRAYAIPVLIVATFLCGMDLVGPQRALLSGDSTQAPAVAAPQDTHIYIELPEDNPTDAPTGAAADALPPGRGAYTASGKGTFHVVGGTSKVYGKGPLQQYTVEVEDGVTLDERAFAAEVERILGDPRGWGAGSRMSFQRVDAPAQAAFRVSLTSSMTVRQLCGYTVRTETSCYNGGMERAVINDARWVRGATSFGGDLPLYHQYVVTHEVGHSFGHHHELCAGRGGPAPVMMQQTLSTGGCLANPWPFPDGTHEVSGPPAPSNLPLGN